MKIKECSSKLAMGHLHHAVTSLVVDLKRLQPIRLTIKQTSTHKHFSERKSSRNHRWSRQQDNCRIPIFLLDHYYDDQASNDMNHKPKQDDRMIWLDQIRRPIWQYCMSHFSVPTFGKHLLTLSCHFPFWQMSHTRWAGHPSERWGTGLQLHQGCYRQWSRGRFFHFFYCSGISAGWKTSHPVISAHSWQFLWEPSDHWLFHGMKSWLAAEKEELNQSQCWKRVAILLKWKVVF